MSLNYKKLIELGARCTKAPSWRWEPGMKTLTGARVLDIEKDTGIVWAASYKDKLFELDLTTELPDLSDSATRGCLVTLIRERLKSPSASTTRIAGAWLISMGTILLIDLGYNTEEEAITSALQDDT